MNSDQTSPGKANNLINFARDLFPFIKPHRWLFSAMVISLLADAAFQTALPIFLKVLIDDAVVPQNHDLMTQLLIGLAAAVLLISLIMVWRDHLYVRLGGEVIKDVRQRLFHHLQTLSMAYYQRTASGDIMARFTTDLTSIEDVVVGAIPNTLTAILSLIFLSVTLFALDLQLALISLLLIPATWLGPRLLLPKAAVKGDIARKQEGQMLDAVLENINAQATIKSMGLEARENQRFTTQLNTLQTATSRFNFLSYLAERMPNLGVLVVYVISLSLAAHLAFDRSISVGTLVAFGALFQNLSTAIAQLSSNLPIALQASAGMRRIQSLLNETPAIKETKDPCPLTNGPYSISLENVALQIHGKHLLKDISLQIKEGETVAIVGPSGCGKSTLLSLIARLQDPTVGSVQIAGMDLSEVTIASLRERMSLVLQDSVLFEADVRDNLSVGRPSASDEDIKRFAALAEADDFIQELPRGYDTWIGAEGEKLSGGQRQRLAIARAFIRQTPLLLLDEPSSALDPISERAITQALSQTRHGRTTVLVTHNLEQAQTCDRIIVLDRGQLQGFASHEQLMQEKGLYANMWLRQSGIQLSDDMSVASVTPEWLTSIPLFEGLPLTVLKKLAASFKTETVGAGRTVIRQRNMGDKFFIIARGTVLVRMGSDPDFTGFEVARLQRGDAFGELALLDDTPRNATVRTLVDSIFLTLERSAFQQLIQQSPELSERVRTLGEKRQ